MSLITWRLAFRRRASALRRWTIGALATRQTAKARTKIIFAVSIFVLAFVVRSLHAGDLAPLMYTIEQPFNGLTETHDLRAVSILKGEGLLGPYNIDPSDTKWLTQAPGYSIFLSGVYSVFGRDFFKVQLVQNLVNSFSAVLIFLIAGSLISWRVGVASGVMAALSHHLGHISNFILPDAMLAFPVLAAVYLLVIARRSRHPYWLYAAAGLMMGLASWLRAQTMLLGLFVAALTVMLAIAGAVPWSAAKHAVVTAAISLLAIAPITIRNYLVYGDIVPINIGAGIVLWEGIADASGDRFGAVARDEEVAAQEAILYNDPRYAGSWGTPDGIRRDRDRIRKGLAVIRQHPFWYARVMAGRMCGMMSYSAHAPLLYGINQARTRERTAPIRKGWESIVAEGRGVTVGRALFWMRPVIRPLQRMAKEAMQLMIAIGALFLFIACSRRALLISLVPLYYLLFQSFVHTEFRYTLPMQFFLFVFAATVWVLIGSSISSGVKRLLLRVRGSTFRRKFVAGVRD